MIIIIKFDKIGVFKRKISTQLEISNIQTEFKIIISSLKSYLDLAK